MSHELLDGYTQRIRNYEVENTKNFVYIGMNLFEIQEMNLLENTDYKNIKQYTLNEFGYESSTTYNLINVYKKFFHSSTAPKVKFNALRDYSLSQLVNMLNMSDDELKLCDSKMSVKQIKEIRLKKSIRMDSASIENTEKLKNEIPGQNIIKGVFPEKKEEEKQNTLIVSELPKVAPATTETRTIVTETITSQNNDFVPNNTKCFLMNSNESYADLTNQITSLNKEIQCLNQSNSIYKDMFSYIHKELFESVKSANFNNIRDLVSELNEFIHYEKVPEKIKFMREVI